MSSNLWKKYKLDELSQIIFSGGTPNTRKPEYWDGKYNWLSSGETSNTYITKTSQTITELGVKESSTRLAKKGDVVIASAGQGFTRGQASFCKIDTYINQSIVAIRCNRSIANNLYVFYNLKSRYEELRQISDGHSIRGSLTTKMMRSFDILLPSLNIQSKIANILSSLDDKIELNNKINKNLEEIAQTLYKRWFVDFEFPNENGEPYKSSGGEMVDSELGTIPKGWEVATLEDLAAKEKNAIVDGPFGTQMKISEYVDFGIPIVEMYQLNGYENVKGYRNFITLKKYEEVKRSTVKQGDVIISKTGTLGLLGMLNRKYDKGILVSRLGKITPDTSIIKSSTLLLLMHYLSDSNHWYQIASGSTMPLLNIGNIKKTKIVFPIRNSEISLKFESIVDEMIQKINSNLFENHKLSIMRDELLPKLMSGEIEVPVEE